MPTIVVCSPCVSQLLPAAYCRNRRGWAIRCFAPIGTVDSEQEIRVRDIAEVIQKKQKQQEQLAKQIEALQGAARELDAVKHMLEDGESATLSMG